MVSWLLVGLSCLGGVGSGNSGSGMDSGGVDEGLVGFSGSFRSDEKLRCRMVLKARFETGRLRFDPGTSNEEARNWH